MITDSLNLSSFQPSLRFSHQTGRTKAANCYRPEAYMICAEANIDTCGAIGD